MRLSARYLGDSFHDFIENTRTGATLFRMARLAAFGLGLLVVGKFASGQFLSLQFRDLVFVAIAGVVFMVVSWRREVGIVLILCSTSFIVFYAALPTLSLYHFIPEIKILEELRLHVGQGLMVYMLAVFAISFEAETMRRRLATPLTPTVLLFMLAVFTAAIVGVFFRSVHLPIMVETARPYSYYLMFFVTLLCVRGRRELKIVMGALYAMSLIVAILMFAQFALGDRVRLFVGSRETVRVELALGGFAGRILPPGETLIWMITPFVMVWVPMLKGWAQRLVRLSVGVLLGGLLLTFTRSEWMGLLLSMWILMLLGRGPIRQGVLRVFAVMGIFVLLLFMVLRLVSTGEDNYVTPYIKRFMSTFSLESYAEGTSGGARLEEIRAAWPKIREHPWLGVGVGGTYRHVSDWDDVGQQHYLRPVSYIHNAYVLLLTHTGVVGFVSCMTMFAVFFARARRILRRLSDEKDRSLVMAAISAVASVMLASMMQPSLWYPAAVPLLGTIFGLVELLRYFAEEEDRSRSTGLGALRAGRQPSGFVRWRPSPAAPPADADS